MLMDFDRLASIFLVLELPEHVREVFDAISVVTGNPATWPTRGPGRAKLQRQLTRSFLPGGHALRRSTQAAVQKPNQRRGIHRVRVALKLCVKLSQQRQDEDK